MTEILLVKELRACLKDIDNCENKVDVTFVTGVQGQNPCTMDGLCDECVNRLAGLLEWAVDDAPEQLELPLKS